MRSARLITRIVAFTLVLAPFGCARLDTDGAAKRDWPMYRGELSGTGYSSLAQIDTSNVANLTQAWSYALQSDAAPAASGQARTPPPNSQATPIVVRGVMYLPAADRVVALDPVTGTEIWRHEVVDGTPSRRGVAYWPGDRDAPPGRKAPAD